MWPTRLGPPTASRCPEQKKLEVDETTGCTPISEQRTSHLLHWLPRADSHAAEGFMALALGSGSGEMIGQVGAIGWVSEKKI
jgi:hypothetical protein